MKYLKLAFLVSVICLMSHFYFGNGVFSQSSQPSLQLITEPTLEQIRPFDATTSAEQQPVRFTLQTLDSNKQPLRNAQVHLTLLTPPRSPWFSTDFPWVEGTTLLEFTQTSATGSLEFQQSLPIRGDYTLKAEVKPLVANDFQPFQQNLTFAIAENSGKYQNYFILLGFLILVGFTGGWIIGTKEKTQVGEIAPQRVRLLLSGLTVSAIAALLWMNISAELPSVHSHSDHNHDHDHHTHDHSETQILTNQAQNAGVSVKLLGDNHAIVGQLANFQIKAINPETQQAITDLPLTIQAHQLESDRVIFATQAKTDVQGQFSWQEQFFDGSPHQVIVTVPVNEEAKALQVGQEIEVEGLHPPLFARLVSLGYMVMTLAIAFIVSFWIRRFRSFPHDLENYEVSKRKID